MKINMLVSLLFIMLLLSACSSSSIYFDLEESIALAEEFPQVNPDYFIVSGDSITYNFGNSPTYTDSLTLTKKAEGIEQTRQITFMGVVPDTFVLDLPKSFAENTDQLSVTLKNSEEELEWKVIEFDPVIELINLKQKELSEPISVHTSILFLNSKDGLERLMYQEARRHQLHNILANADSGKKSEDFFLLALLQKFPEQFDDPNRDCHEFSNKNLRTACLAMYLRDPSLCGYSSDEDMLCRRMALYAEINRFYPPVTQKEEEILFDFMKEYDVSDCSKLSFFKADCEDYFPAVQREDLPEDEQENKKLSNKKNADFNLEQEYDYYFMFEHPEDACEQINLGYEIKTASYVTRKLLMCEFERDDEYGFVRLSINPFRSGEAALSSWVKFGNPDNPPQLRIETTNPKDQTFNAHNIEETYKNVRISVSGTMNMEVSGLVDTAKDYVDSILPEYELND